MFLGEDPVVSQHLGPFALQTEAQDLPFGSQEPNGSATALPDDWSP
jgi:hypothetical protein